MIIYVSGREYDKVVDVVVRRSSGGGLSDHYLVVKRVKIKKGLEESRKERGGGGD